MPRLGRDRVITVHRHPGLFTRYFWAVYTEDKEKLGYTFTKTGAIRKLNKALKEFNFYDC